MNSKTFEVFKSIEDRLYYIGKNKDTFQEYLYKNYSEDGYNQWFDNEINDSIEAGDATEDHPIAIAIFDNGNEWVYCYPDAGSILYTQKQFDFDDELAVDMGDAIIYFKETALLSTNEKELIK